MKSHHYHYLRSHLLIIWAALLLMPLSSAQPQNHIEISKFPFQESFQMSSSETRFYLLDLATTPKNLGLIISVLPQTGSDSPKLFVSHHQEFPQKMDDADYSSIVTPRNDIFISNKDIIKDSSNSLYIGLLCGSPKCDAQILTEWANEIQAIANEEKTITNLNGLNSGSSAIVRLTIPDEDEIERIVIHVDAIKTSMEEFPSLEVFITQGTTIPFEKVAESIARKGAWFEGNTIVIDKDSSLFCNNCIYTLNLKFTESSSVSIQAQTYKKSTVISGEPILDGVQKGKESFYRFTRRENEKEADFVLSVKVHQGKVKVSIGFQEKLESLASYQVENSQDITISFQERWHSSAENYFILVEGDESSVYSLSATYKNSNQLLMGKDTPVCNEIFPHEKITYEILMPLFIAEEITISLYPKKSLSLNITRCRFPTDCPGLLPAPPQHKITNYYGFNGLSIEKFDFEEASSDYKMEIKINPHKSGCYPVLAQDQTFTKEPIPVCAYSLTISNQQSSSVEFTLTAEYKRPNFLTLGESRFDIVTKQNMLYYVLYVPPHRQNIESIQIQFTKFSGDLDIFLSKSNKNPNKQSHDNLLTFSFEDLLIIKDRPDLSGIYFIGVQGLETSSFSLSAIVKLKSGMNEDSAFLLNPGKPQKGILLHKHRSQAQFYKILLNQDQNWFGYLRITVKSLSGRVLIVVNNNGEFPTTENHRWESKDHDLKISSKDFDFKKRGFYYIGIFTDVIDDLPYYITYSLITYPDVSDGWRKHPVHIFLSPNTRFYDVIEKRELHHFEALIPIDQFPVTIHKQSASENVKFSISMDPKEKYLDQYQGMYAAEPTEDFRTLESCKVKTNLGCSVYITAVLTGDSYKTPFSLSISYSQKSSARALKDGQQLQSTIPTNNLPAIFYYHAIPSKLFVVHVSAPGKQAVIYAKRIKVNIESQEEPNIEILNETTAEFTGVSSLYVPPLTDSEITIVAVSVYFEEPKEKPKNSEFAIEASSQITQLSLGTPYSGFGKKDKYFMINVKRSECVLLISLSNLDRYDLVVSKGENASRTKLHFARIPWGENQIIEINNTDISPGDSMSGNWILEVHASESSAFTLTVIYEDQKMIDLNSGAPLEMMSLKESSFVYFKYKHADQQNFQLNLTKFSGQFNLYMTLGYSGEDLLTAPPNQTHYSWQILRVASQSVMTISQYYYSRTYLIKIEAISSSNFSLAIGSLSKDIPIQGGIQYKGQLKPQESTVFMLRKSTNFSEENQLDIEMKGNELSVMGSESPMINLENYVWRETLKSTNPHRVISLKTEDLSRDSFSLLLENPKDKDVDYSFNMITRPLQLQKFFGENAERLYELNPLEKKYFIYNSIDRYGFEADVIFYAERQNNESIMEKDLSKGQKIKARYWYDEQETTEQEIYLEAGAEPKNRSNSTHAIFEQKFSIKDPTAKCMIEIANPWKFQVKFRIFMRKSSFHRNYYGLNGDNIIRSDTPEFYAIGQPGPANWYFWLYSCGTTIDLKIENGDIETGMATIPKGNSYFSKEAVTDGPRNVSIDVNQKSPVQRGTFFLYTSVFDEKELKDFDVKEEKLGANVTFQILKQDKSEVTVEFKPIELQDPESHDEIDYRIWLCPDRLELSTESPLCHENNYLWRCQYSSLRLKRSQKEQTKISFENVDFGEYFVKIQAKIIYRSRSIKNVEVYPTVYMKVGKSIFREIFKFFIGINILIVITGLLYFTKFKRLQKDQGLELQDRIEEYKPPEVGENQKSDRKEAEISSE